jgi:hypothetical protein
METGQAQTSQNENDARIPTKGYESCSKTPTKRQRPMTTHAPQSDKGALETNNHHATTLVNAAGERLNRLFEADFAPER